MTDSITTPVGGHTPGPWEACDPGDYGDFNGESRVILGDDRRIAVVHWSPRLNTAQSDANACLIAAAPELLAALVELLEPLERASALLVAAGKAADENAEAAFDRARAAISKATGVHPHE